MCGILAIVSEGRDVIADGIILLNAENQRGEQGCGGVSFDGQRTHYYYGEGKVSEVFGPRDRARWSKLVGSTCLMHVLYSTVGKKGDKQKQPRTQQPVIFKFRGRIAAVAHNGNLVRLDGLRKQAKLAGYKFKSDVSDTEVIAALISTSKKKDFLEALIEVLKKIEGKGSFSLGILYKDKIYGVRDQNGNKPLCIIKKDGKNGDEDSYILASEGSVMPTLEATRFLRHVDMGELVVLGAGGIEKSVKWTKKVKSAFCVSEFVYFANPATRFFGVSVNAYRYKAGEVAARGHPVEADVVMAIPESGRQYNNGFSFQSGIPCKEGILKNRHAVDRTFMGAREENRGQKQRVKLQADPDAMEGLSICLIEDSVYRCSVSPMVVKMCREHGKAREVHLRVCSPPVSHCCHLGIDTSTKEELPASSMTVDEIRDQIIHADSLEYLTLPEMKQVLRELGLDPDDFCFGCFNGKYPVAPPRQN